MSYDLVIARAFGGKPNALVFIHRNRTLAYLAAPDRTEAVEAGESIAIGYPIEDVFVYNTTSYEDLRTEWDHSGEVSHEKWENLTPYLAT